MAKLHELLAAESVPKAAWNTLLEETKKKLKASGIFEGHSKSLHMTEDSPANKITQDQNREEKPVITTVYDTLEYAFGLFGANEDLQYQKNETNRQATGTVMWRGKELLKDMPVDELLGLEDRIKKLRELFVDIPTLDASKHWVEAANTTAHVWELKYPDETAKTEKTETAVILVSPTKEHPAQVKVIPKDIVVGKFTIMKRSGAATALQKADSIKRIDELLIEVKQARMRANETKVSAGRISDILVPLLLEPLE